MRGSTGFELQEFFPYKLTKVADLVGRAFSEVYTREFGITQAEWRLIVTIGERQPVLAKDLVESTFMDKVKVSRALQKMEQKNLVKKQSAEFDHRSLLVMLTEEGEQLLSHLLPEVIEWEAELLNTLSAADYKNLSISLNRLIEHLSAYDRKKSLSI